MHLETGFPIFVLEGSSAEIFQNFKFFSFSYVRTGFIIFSFLEVLLFSTDKNAWYRVQIILFNNSYT